MADAFDPYITPQDYIVLQGAKSPGKAVVTGATDKRKWDIQIGYALSGGITIYRGKEISKFSVVLTLATAQDWIDWAAWRKLVARPPNGVRPKAMTIEHPWLRMLDIHEVSIEEVGQPEESDETGAWTVTIKFLEFRLPKPVFLKPEAAKVKPTDDPESLQIAALLAEKMAKAAKVAAYQGGGG
jgi:hypothetical protein